MAFSGPAPEVINGRCVLARIVLQKFFSVLPSLSGCQPTVAMNKMLTIILTVTLPAGLQCWHSLLLPVLSLQLAPLLLPN